MGKIFSYDGSFVRTLEKICDLMLLHFFWIISSIPIITIGASTTALLSVSMKSVRGEDGYVFRDYVTEFKSNFKKSTCIWLIFLGFILCDLAMIYLAFHIGTNTAKLYELIELVLLIFVIFALKYVFAIQARFENTIINTIKNAFILSLRHLPFTVAVIMATVMPIVLTVWMVQLRPIMIFLWIFLGSSLIALADSYVFVNIFKYYEK